MNNDTPVIDLSLRAPQLIIADKGLVRGIILVMWFRLLRPSCVGAMWAAITIYAYRYLLPFDQGDLSWTELISYVGAIGIIGVALTVWLILSHVAHPFTSKSRTQRLLRRKARITVEPGPFTEGASRDWDPQARVFVASHDPRGMIAGLEAQSLGQTVVQTRVPTAPPDHPAEAHVDYSMRAMYPAPRASRPPRQ
ncbi:Biofilm PGA synthesis auxiliary protein PgaD [Paraburkholderia bannensis]|uniref:Biofilm PGA synthesis auxiliary protein PgaD n=1 Tax=Paraburkholderia bannensis TaxID=765414 RepID=UPI002AB66DC4|nr:Biofilm PGA synthesis auxiliary protein PgaD [Paraburkholderia bannensis]